MIISARTFCIAVKRITNKACCYKLGGSDSNNLYTSSIRAICVLDRFSMMFDQRGFPWIHRAVQNRQLWCTLCTRRKALRHWIRFSFAIILGNKQTIHFYNDRSLGFVKLNWIVEKAIVRAYFSWVSYCISFDHGKRDRDKNRELSGLGTMNNSVPYLHCIRIDD